MSDPNANPELGGRFVVEIDGVAYGRFKMVNIGASEWGMGEDRAGNDPLVKSTYSGLKKPLIIELTKVLVEGGAEEIRTFIDWHSAGSTDKRKGAIIETDREGNEVLRHTFSNAWVSKVDYPKRDATAEDAAAEYTFHLSVSEVNVA